MSPHYDRNSDFSNTSVAQRELGGPEDEAIDAAAEALREVEVKAVQPSAGTTGDLQLERMSIDELRKLAAEVHVPNRGQIVDQDELIAAIRQRL